MSGLIADDLRLAESDNGSVLVDIKNDRILKLNRLGSEIWGLARAGQTESQIVQTISERYKVDECRAKADVRSLFQKVAQFQVSPADIAIQAESQGGNSAVKRPSFPWYGQTAVCEAGAEPEVALVLSALLGLAAFDLILFFGSLRLLCAGVKTLPVKTEGPACKDTIPKVCAAVDRACVLYPKKSLCLQRSAVTACLLKSHGLAAQMIVGIRPIPFLAHAWVEADGAVVNDWPGVRRFYSSVARY
jgi:hypothetical protein